MACCWYPSSRGQVNRLESELELLQNSVPLDQFDTVPVELDSLTAGSQLYESVGELLSALVFSLGGPGLACNGVLLVATCHYLLAVR